MSPTGSLLVRFAALLQARCVVGVAAVVALYGCKVDTDQASISLLEASQAAAILRAVGLPEGATPVSEIEESGPDGPMPEIARRSFIIPSSPVELRAELTRRCSAAGLGEPDAEMLETEPSILCSGQIAGGRSHLLMSASCSEDACEVMLEVHRSPF